jgi:hypothetical protein
MRTHDGQLQGVTVQVANNAGQFPGGFWLNPSAGVYDFYLTEPGAKWLSVAPGPSGSGAPLAMWFGTANYESPARAQVRFQTAAGASGSYGGTVAASWRRGQV